MKSMIWIEDVWLYLPSVTTYVIVHEVCMSKKLLYTLQVMWIDLNMFYVY